MALFNHATKEVTAKLVYYGPGLCGKTTNLQWIHENLAFKSKGKLVSLATQTDRTLFFDFLPIELGKIRGMRTRMQIYTVPGQVFYETTRRMVLKGCDAVVFVADSQAAMLDANFESLQSLRKNLLANEIDPSIPMVLQYNKRDLPTALPVSVLNARLNPRNVPYFESVAFKGTGVEETLRGVTKALFRYLSDYYAADKGADGATEPPEPTKTPASSPPQAVKITVPDPQPQNRVSARPAVKAKPKAPSAPAPPPEPAPASARPTPEPPATPPPAPEPPAAPPSTPPAPEPPTASPAPKEPPPTAEREPVMSPPVGELSAPDFETTAGDPLPPTIRIKPRRIVIPPKQPPAAKPAMEPAVTTPPVARPEPPAKPAPVARPEPPRAPEPTPAPRPQAPPRPEPPAAPPARPTAPVAEPTPPPVAKPEPPPPPPAPEPPAPMAKPTPPPPPPPAPQPPAAPEPPPVQAEAPPMAKPEPEPELPPVIIEPEPEPAPPAVVEAKPEPPVARPEPPAAPPEPPPVAKPEPPAVVSAPPMPEPPPPPAPAPPPVAPPEPPPVAKPEPPPPPPAPPPEPEPDVEDEPAPTVMLRAGASKEGVFQDAKAAAGDPPPRGDDLREDQWLYLLEGAQRGPVDVEDLVDLVLTSIPEDTKVWHPGLEGWVRANQVRQIAEEIPPPLPVPGAASGFSDEEMPDFDTVPPQFRTALIADEDEAFRKYLAMPLAAQGFTIHEAADGSAAWQLAVQNRPWLILADVNMPEVDGFEFCQRVRNHPLLSHTPLLFISGSDKYKERYRALQIGADDFLTKQTKIREILMRIQLLLTKYSDLGAEQEQATAEEGEAGGIFQGRVEVFGAPALLQMCAQGRLTGLFTALAEDEENTAAVMGFREGEIISATVGAEQGLEAAYAFLAWPKGSFKFTPGEPGEGEPLAQSVEHLLLEGCRLLDESQKDGTEGEEASFI